jgi:peptide/nickel transport system substrate-binding protein
LYVAVTSDAGTLSPALIGTGTYGIVAQIQEPMWDVDQDGNVIYILAESVDFVSDTEQIIHLRHDVNFHNGNPFTASDVLFSMNLHNNSGFTGQPRVQTVDFEKTMLLTTTRWISPDRSDNLQLDGSFPVLHLRRGIL